jgi:hypothetical protein
MADESLTVRTEGPHTPAYSRQLAATIAEAVRALNHASIGKADGFKTPQDVESVVGSLVLAMERLPQLLGQLAAVSRDQAATCLLHRAGGGDAAGLAEWAAVNLEDAAPAVAVVARCLRDAKLALADLYLEGDDDDEQ